MADVDNDGDQDVLLMGEMVNGRLTTRLYRNDRAMGFAEVFTSFAAVRSGFADWGGDMDADGDMDLLISGESSNGAVSIVYRNDRENGFTDIDAGLIPLYMSDGEWGGDYDLDGDLDIIISGGMTNDYSVHTRIYRNDGWLPATAAVEEVSDNIWNNHTVVPERAEPIYYFVYSSSYGDLTHNGKKKAIMLCKSG